MMTETPIAFGLTMVVCLALFFYCWYIRQLRLRHRLNPFQVSATPEVHEHTGIKKDVVNTFPTVRTYELKVDIKGELQCPICLVEYGNTELLRKLPFCDHVFHIHCVDPWLQKHVTCPVCRIVLTEYTPKPETYHHQTLQTTYCRGPSAPNYVTIEISPATPAWVSVNPPMPLPPSAPLSSSSQTLIDPQSRELDTELQTLGSSDSGYFDIDLQPRENVEPPGDPPLLQPPNAAGWGSVYLENKSDGFGFRSPAADTAMIDTKESTSERWMAGSFSFDDPTTRDDDDRVSSQDEPARTFRSSRRGGSKRARLVTMSWDFGQSSDEDVVESMVGSPEPLTVSPEHCSFEFLPIVTGPGGDYSLTDFHR